MINHNRLSNPLIKVRPINKRAIRLAIIGDISILWASYTHLFFFKAESIAKVEEKCKGEKLTTNLLLNTQRARKVLRAKDMINIICNKLSRKWV
jgi:hypothetical protein